MLEVKKESSMSLTTPFSGHTLFPRSGISHEITQVIGKSVSTPLSPNRNQDIVKLEALAKKSIDFQTGEFDVVSFGRARLQHTLLTVKAEDKVRALTTLSGELKGLREYTSHDSFPKLPEEEKTLSQIWMDIHLLQIEMHLGNFKQVLQEGVDLQELVTALIVKNPTNPTLHDTMLFVETILNQAQRNIDFISLTPAQKEKQKAKSELEHLEIEYKKAKANQKQEPLAFIIASRKLAAFLEKQNAPSEISISYYVEYINAIETHLPEATRKTKIYSKDRYFDIALKVFKHQVRIGNEDEIRKYSQILFNCLREHQEKTGYFEKANRILSFIESDPKYLKLLLSIGDQLVKELLSKATRGTSDQLRETLKKGLGKLGDFFTRK